MTSGDVTSQADWDDEDALIAEAVKNNQFFDMTCEYCGDTYRSLIYSEFTEGQIAKDRMKDGWLVLDGQFCCPSCVTGLIQSGKHLYCVKDRSPIAITVSDDEYVKSQAGDYGFLESRSTCCFCGGPTEKGDVLCERHRRPASEWGEDGEQT